MNKIFSRRMLATVLVLLSLLAVAAPAFAAVQLYTTQSVTVRSGPGTGYSSLGTLNKGEVVTKTGSNGAWTVISFNGKKGYVQTTYLKTYTASDDDEIVIIDNTSGSGRSTVYATGTVNVRSGPGTGYAKLGQLNKGDAIQKVGTTGSWTIVDWATGTAYISSSYLTTSGSSGSTGGTSSGTMVATANVNVRSGPGTNYSVVGWLTKGTTVTRTGTSGNWTRVNYNGLTAYVYSSYLSVYSGSSSGQTVIYARYETEVRTGPGSSNRIIGYLDPGQSVVYLSTTGSWYKVQYGANIGYVYGPDMRNTSSDVSSSSGYVYATTSARVYEGPGTSYSTLGYLYTGESARRTGTAGSTWTRITYDGQTGYVRTSQVTTVTGNGSYGMSTLNKWGYAVYSKVYCYSVPIASSSYRLGYLDKNEAVWCLEGNSYWTKVLVDDDIMYVQANELGVGSGKTSSSSGGGSTAYKTGTRLYVIKITGAPTYSNTAGDPFRANGELTDYGSIEYRTALTVKFQVNNMVCVTWVDDRDPSTHKTFTAYVDVGRVSTTRP